MLEKVRLALALRRNRLIGSQAIRSLADWFPPARRPARRYARALFDLSAGFVYAQIAQAMIESGLLERLHQAPTNVSEAARQARLSEEATITLLKAAASLRLAEAHGQLWVLGPLGAALAASPGVPEMIRHHRLLYADLADPLAMLRKEVPGRLAALWRYDTEAVRKDIEAYSALMAASQPMVAAQAIAAYSFGRHRSLLDIGGGSGTFLRQVERVAPHLTLGLFDRPGVIEQAKTLLGARATYYAGSFFDDSLPRGFDLISLVRVLHDHDDEPANRLLGSVRTALEPDGHILIVEPLANTAGAEPMGDAYFGFYLAAMGSGRPRSFNEYSRMLADVGFRKVHLHRAPLPLVASVISAQK